MVKKKIDPRCGNCIWHVNCENSSLVFCKWLRINVYSSSLPCVDYELYEEPF